ncbi:MAG TPA: transglutaminase family protein [Chthoniobacterales bacterium]|nr:transglutaminase family protein [Chthoniobacterales bacterium]
MKIGIRYETVYRYDRAVRFSPHDVRLFPRSDRFVQIARLDFRTKPETTVRFGRDVFDNVVASCFFEEAAEALELRLAIDVEVAKKNPFDFVLARRAVQMPFAYEEDISSIICAYCQRQTGDKISLPGWTLPMQDSPRETVATLVELTKLLHHTISYQRREEGAAQAPAETLRLRHGACRDTAVLLAEILRDTGLAARVVSGYLRETDEEIRRSEGSLHAWTEVFLPGAGWVGLDPTNGILCNDNFIAAAVGLRPADITPIGGSFYHRDRVPAEMQSRLELITL